MPSSITAENIAFLLTQKDMAPLRNVSLVAGDANRFNTRSSSYKLTNILLYIHVYLIFYRVRFANLDEELIVRLHFDRRLSRMSHHTFQFVPKIHIK